MECIQRGVDRNAKCLKKLKMKYFRGVWEVIYELRVKFDGKAMAKA